MIDVAIVTEYAATQEQPAGGLQPDANDVVGALAGLIPDPRMTTWRGIGGGPVQRAVRGTVRGWGRKQTD